MELFNLPPTTVVNRVIPKNAFDAYATTKQKALMTSQVLRMVWTNKIALETVNLEGTQIKEIQIFRVELKDQKPVAALLNLIDKAIPYPIVFVVQYSEDAYLSTSVKHLHPTDKELSVIESTLYTGWLPIASIDYSFSLKRNLETVYLDICKQISGTTSIPHHSVTDLVAFVTARNQLLKEITSLQSRLKATNQFNQKVALNLLLQQKEAALNNMNSCYK